MESKSRITAGGKLTRQKSRLQMHAPSSIQVAPAPAASVAEWNVAIPLLSPLDIVSLPNHWEPTAEIDQGDKRQPSDERKEDDKDRSAMKWSTWQHPAEPFYYEPVAGNGPGACCLPVRDFAI